jgi:NAD(P)-dependent dehydrogenase (short-subunit alcohol dehydrogenase family)
MSCPQLAGQVALVTGAGTGLGRQCAIALGEEGATVILVGRTEESLCETADIMRSRSAAAPHVRRCDVTLDDEVDRLFDILPRCDILINNAGKNVPQPFVDVRADTLDEVIQLNVRAVFRVAQAAVRKMSPQKTGVIVNMSSQMGHVGAAGRSAYCMTKHAVEGLTKALAVELGPRGIRVNALAPTYVETPLTRPFLSDPTFRAEALRRIPLGCMAEPRDVAEAAIFLITAPMITGISLLVDGGYTAQ